MVFGLPISLDGSLGPAAKKTKLYNEIKEQYDKQGDIKYGAARMWVDEIIDPAETRKVLIRSLKVVNHQTKMPSPNFGVFQV